MSTYLVIGLYPDINQRFASTVEAESPKAAERAVLNHPEDEAAPQDATRGECGLIIAAVILNGEVVA